MIFCLGTITIILLCGYAGLLVYATYHDCDPLTTKLAKAKDQLLPLLVMRVLGDFPGMPGLFVAGIFSAALRFFVHTCFFLHPFLVLTYPSVYFHPVKNLQKVFFSHPNFMRFQYSTISYLLYF